MFRLCCTSLVFFLSLVQTGFGQPVSTAGPDLGRGIVIEKIQKHSEAEKFGLREGDILLRWSRGDHTGTFDSPFDLSFVDREERPRGNVTIEGVRGAEQMAWKLGPECWCVWNVVTRPNFSPGVLQRYRQAEQLLRLGRVEDAKKLWRKIATRKAESGWLYPWLLSHSVGSLSNRKHWRTLDRLLKEAIQETSTASLRGYLHRLWASSFAARSDLVQSTEHFQQALQIDLPGGKETLTVAEDLSLLGCTGKGYTSDADNYLARAISIQEKLAPMSIDLAHNLVVAGYLAAEQQVRPEEAAEDLKQALAILRNVLPSSPDVSFSLVLLGTIAQYRGEFSNAQDYYHEVLSFQRKLGARDRNTGLAVAGLAAIALLQGELPKAEYYQRRALRIQWILVPDSLDVADSLTQLANISSAAGDTAKAEVYQRQALRIYQKLIPGNITLCVGLDNLGKILLAEGRRVEAAKYFRLALAMSRTIAPSSVLAAAAWEGLGQLYQHSGHPSQAEESYRKSLAIVEKMSSSRAEHTELLAAIAETAMREERWGEAVKLYDQTVKELETATSNLEGGRERQSGFRARHEDIYRNYIDLLISQNQPERAFEVLEQSRARSLLEALASAHIDIRKGADPALLQQERSLQESLTARSDQRLHLLNGVHTEEQLKAVDREIADLLSQYQEVEGQLRSRSPAYAALTQPQPLSISQVQRQLLDNDTLLVEYSLGEQRSYLFALTSASLQTYPLPSRKRIEQEARRVYHLLKLSGHANKLQTQARLQAGMFRLSQMIMAPVASELNRKRLLIVSDGALAYIPFAALPDPSGTTPKTPLKAAVLHQYAVPLIADHEVVNLPSASVLAVLQQQMNGRQPAPKAVAVLADPVFSQEDSRVKAAGSSPQATAASEPFDADLPRHLLVRSAADVSLGRNGALHLTRLPFTRLEAEAIAAVTSPGERLQALDFHASRSTATSPDLAQYRIVHFATHGLLDSQNPELSGLVLSLVDEQGQPQNGFLELEDIYNLNLSADLVVLSACETGLGKQIDGEGLVGLTRGFMYAGASRVVASLWRVDDEATAELMKKFYQAMLQDGERPAQALRTAQMWMREQKAWAAPYYWAGFVLQGEWQ